MVKDGVEIIFIDQLSKIRGGKGKTEYEQRTYIVNELATLKKDLRIPVCLLAQINRKLEDRQNKKPTLGDLKSTGALEEDADIILLGHREYEYVKTEENIHHAEWELAKHKQGATTNINMFWDGKTVTFSPIQVGII
jgi:replicative DNA helicase